MNFQRKIRMSTAVFLAGVSATLLFAATPRPALKRASNQEKAAEPWPSATVLHPEVLAHELGNAKGESTPTIVYVGFRTLFEGGHIPGAKFQGTASKDDGLTELKKWAAALPRSTNLVIYCGCCPFDHCPNIRPAYKALHEMGFSRLRVLVLPTSFATDWVEKGFPIQKGL